MLNTNNKYIKVVLIIFLINLILDYGVVSYYMKSTYVYILLGLITVKRGKNEI